MTTFLIMKKIYEYKIKINNKLHLIKEFLKRSRLKDNYNQKGKLKILQIFFFI